MGKEPFFDVWFIDDVNRTRIRGTWFQRAVVVLATVPFLIVLLPIIAILEARLWWARVRS